MNLSKLVSLISLSVIVLPCLLFLSGTISHSMVKWTALAGTIGWFIATPLWMSRKLPIDASEVEI